jgi:hypothetical protein
VAAFRCTAWQHNFALGGSISRHRVAELIAFSTSEALRHMQEEGDRRGGLLFLVPLLSCGESDCACYGLSGLRLKSSKTWLVLLVVLPGGAVIIYASFKRPQLLNKRTSPVFVAKSETKPLPPSPSVPPTPSTELEPIVSITVRGQVIEAGVTTEDEVFEVLKKDDEIIEPTSSEVGDRLVVAHTYTYKGRTLMIDGLGNCTTSFRPTGAFPNIPISK